MKHKIKIWYTTGDSFGSQDRDEILEMEWDNLDVAKANLKRIKEHYICYKVDNDFSGKKGYYYKSLSPEDKLIYDTKKTRDWYSTPENWDNYHYSICLKADNGNDWIISPFWVGYFETLNSAHIISDDNDMNISF
jgi:hypothetical protein